MTAMTIHSIHMGANTGETLGERPARRAGTGAFRDLVTAFERSARSRGEARETPAEAPIRPRHVIAAESILARIRTGIAMEQGPDAGVEPQPLPAVAEPVGPVHGLKAAKRVVLGGLDWVENGLRRALRRHGFDRAEVTGIADAAMSGIPHRAEVALNHLPLAPRPVEAAKHLFDAALDGIAGNLARALGRHGLGRDRIAEISHVALTGIDTRVASALDGVAESWGRTRHAAGA